jgi:hypothetical protein
MKMHILAAALLTALASRGASASSEGGDTWSALEPTQRSASLILQAPPHAEPSASGLDASWEGSEGGDTWSHLLALRQGSNRQASTGERAGSGDTGTAGPTAASEGGDTWSHLQPQNQGGPAQTAGLAAKPML